jgi:GH25 family lysozyme M1 (1,4-beta-N-acetylmuramidase)
VTRLSRRLSRRRSVAGSALVIIAGLAIAAATQTAVRGPAALAAATPGAPVEGTDVSSLNGSSINWTDVAGSERFVAVKATEGNYYTDPDYQADVAKAAAAGLFVMPYVFANPYGWNGTNQNSGHGSGQVQADYAWKQAISKVTAPAYASSALMLPVALDLEPDPYVDSEQNSNQCYGLSALAMVAWIHGFINEATADTGKTPVIYTTTSWWSACTGDSAAFSADPLWIASYGVPVPSIPSPWSNLTFWQYSQSGEVNGISGAADLDSLGPAQASLMNTAIPAEQIQTLTSLASQAVPSGYMATGLPTGLSMSASGRVTGTPSVVGQYAVTVTPPAGAAPASMAFTWDVHGAIAPSTANRASTAGTPVWLNVTTSGPDQGAGFAPALTATGLPAGLSMTSAGLITGWLTRPGTYKVAIAAVDALGGTGAASFTWTVKAAPDSGAAGPIRQVGGSGKCLNDPAGKTANGTRIDVWNCIGKSSQRWTVAQDGTLRTGGKCLSVAGDSTSSGARLQLEACDSADGAQLWQAATDGQLVNPQSGKCLDVPAASAANGTAPVIEPCANSASQPNEHWLRPAAAIASGRPGKCIAAAGTAVALATCADAAAQHWQAQPDGTLRVNGECMLEGGTTVRSILSVGSCSGAAAAKWKLVSAGPIASELVNTASGLCASVPASGTRLVIAACAITPATTWHLE